MTEVLDEVPRRTIKSNSSRLGECHAVLVGVPRGSIRSRSPLVVPPSIIILIRIFKVLPIILLGRRLSKDLGHRPWKNPLLTMTRIIRRASVRSGSIRGYVESQLVGVFSLTVCPKVLNRNIGVKNTRIEKKIPPLVISAVDQENAITRKIRSNVPRERRRKDRPPLTRTLLVSATTTLTPIPLINNNLIQMPRTDGKDRRRRREKNLKSFAVNGQWERVIMSTKNAAEGECIYPGPTKNLISV